MARSLCLTSLLLGLVMSISDVEDPIAAEAAAAIEAAVAAAGPPASAAGLGSVSGITPGSGLKVALKASPILQAEEAAPASSSSPTNIIFLMLDDLGRADIGALGAEWETPNIDNLIKTGVTLSHHYVGYVCSTSRSQFLTGRYSFHSGFGTLNVFDINKLGTVPLGTPTLAEYLKLYSSYQTYALGKWQLGMVTNDNLAVNRGFDYFLGFNGGLEDYYTKKRSLESAHAFLDFLENDEPTDDYSEEYSTDQYVSKMIDIIDDHATNEDLEDTPFFIYTGFQTAHTPFAYSTNADDFGYTNYYQTCLSKFNDKIDDFDQRIGVCESMLGLDVQIGKLVGHMQSTDKLKKMWDNTIVVFTSDNGGSLDAGSCNYPLRGGKNTFYEGNQRVLAVVGGGKIPESRQGTILDGLFSNVDWTPTLLSFANVIPSDEYTSSIFDSEVNSYPAMDGYNMYDYIMKPGASPLRDHIMLHLMPKMQEEDDTQLTKPIVKYTINDMSETAIIFYDEHGDLWKYFDAEKSTNPIGNPVINSGWCVEADADPHTGKKSKSAGSESITNVYTPMTNDAYAETLGLYDLTTDLGETVNLLKDVTNDDGDNAKIYELREFRSLSEIINDKINYFVTESDNRDFLYGNFECFTSNENYFDTQVFVHAVSNDPSAWTPFLTQSEFLMGVKKHCGLTVHHSVFQLFTTKWQLPDVRSDAFVADNEKMESLNIYVPETNKQRKFRSDEMGSSVIDVVQIDMEELGREMEEEREYKNGGKDLNVSVGGNSASGKSWGDVMKDNLFVIAGMVAGFLISMVICCAYSPMAQKARGYVQIS